MEERRLELFRRWGTLTIFAAAAGLLAWRAGAGTLFNGDDAVYAEFVREMRRHGDPWHLRLDGVILHQRPPLFPWLLGLSTAIFGETTFALRLPAILAAAGTAALVFRYALRWATPLVAVVAGALVPTLALEFLYARSTTSETTLAFFVLLSMHLWLGGSEARAAGRRPWALVGAGAALGAALMTKQVIGLMPLLAPAAALFAGGRAALPPWRWTLAALGAAALIAGPWHAAMLVWHGREFVDGYVGLTVLHRTAHSVLAPTEPTYYLGVLWRKEGTLALLALLGLGVIGARAARGRGARDVLVVLWPLAVLGAFSAASSRIDYYLLTAYPALALLLSAPLLPIAARRPRIAAALGAGLVAASALAHVPQRLAAPDPFAELRYVAEQARARSAPGDPLYCIDELYLLPRYYADRPTFYVVTRPDRHAAVLAAGQFHRLGTVLHIPARDVPGFLAGVPRYLAILRLADLERVPPPPGSRPLLVTPRYVLFGAGLPPPPSADGPPTTSR